MSISLGIASLGRRRDIDLDQLLDEADRALYRAKDSDRSRVYPGRA